MALNFFTIGISEFQNHSLGGVLKKGHFGKKAVL